MSSKLIVTIGLAAAALAVPRAQGPTDLDVFMSRVLERRDDNWKKLQQYVLEERETFQLIGPGAAPLYGRRNESAWFPRDGIFVKSPLRANGVEVSEADRRKAEETWIGREQAREKRRSERASRAREQTGTGGDVPLTEDGVRQALEPGFVSAAYFLRFTFDPGQYAFAGRESFAGREVLRIEYYPTKLFSDERSRPNRKGRERDLQIEAKMNKVALVTLWIEPTEHQILKYEFSNIDMDFLPGRSIVRVDGAHASMEMGQPFPSVWLPYALRMGFELTTALGQLDGRYAVDYHDYKLATVATRVR